MYHRLRGHYCLLCFSLYYCTIYGVPRSGPAPDVKRGVLNSCVLINGQKFPSLASSDSESPADDLEVGFPVELRRTITMEHEVWIPVRV